MTIYLRIVRILGWALIVFGLVNFAVMFSREVGQGSVGAALGRTMLAFIVPENAVAPFGFLALVLGIGFVVKSRLLAKAVRNAGEGP